MPQFVIEFGKAGAPAEADGRLDAAAFHRNHEAIWLVLARFLTGRTGDVLEVGSGTGQHIVEYARKAPNIAWWPSDTNTKHLDSIAAWRRHSNLPNIRPPTRLDLSDPDWGAGQHGFPPENELLAIVCANVLHIAPWRVAEGLFRGAARYLRPDGRIFIYGPFMRHGRHTAPSNAAFDASLRAQNSEWGVRDTEEVGVAAGHAGLRMTEIVDMPANNLILIFERKD